MTTNTTISVNTELLKEFTPLEAIFYTVIISHDYRIYPSKHDTYSAISKRLHCSYNQVSIMANNFRKTLKIDLFKPRNW